MMVQALGPSPVITLLYTLPSLRNDDQMQRSRETEAMPASHRQTALHNIATQRSLRQPAVLRVFQKHISHLKVLPQ